MMLWFDKHRRTKDDLSAYIDGGLSAARIRSLEKHLAACESCRGDLAGLRATITALQGLPQAESPRSFTLTRGQVAAEQAPARVPSAALNTGVRIAAAGLACALALVFVLDRAGILSRLVMGVIGDRVRRFELVAIALLAILAVSMLALLLGTSLVPVAVFLVFWVIAKRRQRGRRPRHQRHAAGDGQRDDQQRWRRTRHPPPRRRRRRPAVQRRCRRGARPNGARSAGRRSGDTARPYSPGCPPAGVGANRRPGDRAER